MKLHPVLFTLVFAIVTSISCSHASNPVIPQDGNALEPVKLSASEYRIDTRNVFGAWRVQVNTETMTAEVIPARNAQAIGNIFDADLSQFLTKSPCSNCLRIPHIQLDGYGDLAVDISMRHPFSNITARPDLHGFDTRAIIIMGTDNMLTYPGIGVILPDGRTEDALLPSTTLGIMNADGYTSHYDELVTDERYFMGGTDQAGNLNPFFRFFEDPTTGAFNPQSPSGHNVIPVGSDIDTRTAVFDLDLENDGLEFDFYIVADVAYGQSSTFQNRTNPQYYLPWFNRTEAWRVEYWFENHDLTEELGTTTDLVVQVFDWQNGYEVDAGFPNPDNLDGIPQSSDVLQVELSIPDFQDDVIVGTWESGTGSPGDPLQYRLTITNENEFYYDSTGLLAIRDALNGQAFPNGRMGIPATPAGFPYETLDIRDYTLYQFVHVNNPYRNNFLDDLTNFGEYEFFLTPASQFAPADSGTSYARIFGTHHNDPGHTKFTYDWDYNYDGSTFNVDGSGMPSPEIPYTQPGRHDVGCRIRTNSVPPREYRFEFPVYAEGEVFNKNLFTTGDLKYATSMMRSRSAYVNENGFWLVYERVESEIRDIWLAVGNKSGTVTHHRITSSTDGAYSPSITVIESGPNQGVYIAYCQSDASGVYIYSTHGNLDGSGFDPANIERVTTADPAIELYPSIVYYLDLIHVYYMDFRLVEGYINAVHSEDYADTWIEDGWVVDNGSTAQTTPMAVRGGYGNIYLVWSDLMESSTRGSDLWSAISSDGITFNYIENISSFRGDVDEMNPDVNAYKSRRCIAYVVKEASSTDTSLYMKVYNSSTAIDYAIETPNIPMVHSYPSISSNGDDKIFVGWATYRPGLGTMRFKVSVLDPYQLGSFSISSLVVSDDIAVTSANARLISPVIISDLPVDYGIDALVVWTDASGGLYEFSGTNYGNISIAEYILPSGIGD